MKDIDKGTIDGKRGWNPPFPPPTGIGGGSSNIDVDPTDI